MPEFVYPVPLVRAEEFGIRVCSGDPNKQTQSLTSATVTPERPKLSIPSAFGKYKLAPYLAKGRWAGRRWGTHFQSYPTPSS